MASYLRVFGDELDVENLTSTLNIQFSKIWHKGAPRFKSNPNKLNSSSRMNIQISRAEWHQFEQQKTEQLHI